MKHISFLIYFFATFVSAEELIFKCEDGYSYKITNHQKSSKQAFFKNKASDWISAKDIDISNTEFHLTLPKNEYLKCSDPTLNVCTFKKVIFYNPKNSNRARVSEVVDNDCFIGTMGCNEYKKGLRLNKRRCKKIN
jgi:hypothetical protein